MIKQGPADSSGCLPQGVFVTPRAWCRASFLNSGGMARAYRPSALGSQPGSSKRTCVPALAHGHGLPVGGSAGSSESTCQGGVRASSDVCVCVGGGKQWAERSRQNTARGERQGRDWAARALDKGLQAEAVELECPLHAQAWAAMAGRSTRRSGVGAGVRVQEPCSLQQVLPEEVREALGRAPHTPVPLVPVFLLSLL